MKKRKLGANGPEVSAIGLGCMSFAGFFGSTDEDTSLACLDAAVKAGIDFWDTSNVYGQGTSENVIGKFLAAEKPEVTIATKAGIVRGPTRVFNNERDYLRSELEGSLKRLNRDHVELFYIHRREQARPVEEVVETLAGFIDEGLIGGYGLSEVAPSTLRRAAAVHPCMAVQNEYSLWTRQPELGLIKACKDLGTAFIPFSPLARGFFANDPISPDQMAEGEFRLLVPRFQQPNYDYNRKHLDTLREWCDGKGWSVEQLALAWVLDRGDHLIPIPGTRTAEHLNAWLGAEQIELTDQDRAEIEEIMPAGFAHGDRYSDTQIIGVERYC